MVKSFYEVAILKIENSRVKAYNVVGHFLKYIGEYGVNNVQFHSNIIAIEYKSGQTKLYNSQGVFFKVL